MFNDRKQSPELDPVQREAVAWVQKLISGEVTAEDAEALKHWRARSPEHRAAFIWAKETWHGVGPAGRALRERGGAFAADLADIAGSRRAVTRRAWLGGGAAAAAAAAGYMSFNPPFSLWPSLTELNADYRTTRGEQRSLMLAGDIAINLNTQTSIALRHGDEEEDRLELIAGEASFATSPLARRPLVIMAAAGLARADSARFDMRRLSGGDGGAVSVTCFTGAVRVQHRADAAELQPGQRLHYDDGGLGRIAAIDPETASNWQRGIVVFRATPLAEAIEEINRYRPGRIVLMSTALGQREISGRFRIDEMGEVLARLQQAFNAKVQTFPGGIVFLS